MNYKNILKTVPIIQSAALASENAKLLSKKKVKSKDLVKSGVKNIVGIELIKLEAGLI